MEQMMDISEKTGFREYRLLILNEISRTNATIEKLQAVVTEIAIDVSNLKITDKFRSSLWGGVGGIVTTVVITLIVERFVNPR